MSDQIKKIAKEFTAIIVLLNHSPPCFHCSCCVDLCEHGHRNPHKLSLQRMDDLPDDQDDTSLLFLQIASKKYKKKVGCSC